MIDYRIIPPAIMEGIERYVHEGLRPGGFLQAVIRNDLADAVGRADEDSLRALQSIVAWFYNEAPGGCWGSAERLEGWISNTETREAINAARRAATT